MDGSYILEPEKHVPVLRDVDILVIGGSQAGVAAAVSARRANKDARVLLVEQDGFLGGQAVSCMVVQWEFREFTNNAGQVIARGIGKEIIERIVKKGNSDPLYIDWLEGRGPPFKGVPDGRAINDTPLDINDIKLVLAEMCDEAGVEVLLHARAVAALPPDRTSGKPATRGAFIETINGRFAVKARIVIDCSANADVAWWVGGESAVSVPSKIIMNMQAYAWIDNVDLDRFVNKGVFGDRGGAPHYPDNQPQMLDHVGTGKAVMAKGFTPVIDEACEQEPGLCEALEGTGALPQVGFYMKTVRTRLVDCGGTTKRLGTFAIEGPSFKWNQLDPFTVSRAELDQLVACDAMARMHRFIPGWERSGLDRTVSRIGFRQTRIPVGLYAITRRDVETHARFPDVIGRHTGHDVGRRVEGGEYGYDLPYRALVPRDIDGLLFGARCISVETQDADENLRALNAHRGISATMIVSQAAGVAAALCIKHGVEPRAVDVKELQVTLRAQDVVLEAP